MDENVCANAAWGGHLECVRYADENGCPHTYATLGYIDCLHLFTFKTPIY
jgi:hypothetical protein